MSSRLPRLGPWVLNLAVLAACPGSDASGTDSAGSTTGESATGESPTGTTGAEIPYCDVVLHAGSDDAAAVQAALTDAAEGATICFTGGEFAVPGASFSAAGTRGLTLAGGADGNGETVFDFGAEGDAPGLLLTDAEDLTINGLTLRNSGGDGLSIDGGARVKIGNVDVSWAGPSADNGAFGIKVRDVVDLTVVDSEVSDAADAGIWAGQSSNVIFTGNLAYGNVAGLEAENCENVMIFDNEARDNTLGIFVLDLPTMPGGNGGGVSVWDNQIVDNNLANFAPAATLSASVPAGLGVLVLAADEVEVLGNQISGNATTGVLVVSFTTLSLLSGMSYDDPSFDPYPETVEVEGNKMFANGNAPADLFVSLFMQPMMPDIAWDGSVDAAKDNADGHLDLCIRGNGDADFLNLDIANVGANKSSDLSPHDCEYPSRPPVENGL